MQRVERARVEFAVEILEGKTPVRLEELVPRLLDAIRPVVTRSSKYVMGAMRLDWCAKDPEWSSHESIQVDVGDPELRKPLV